jgi:phosphoglycerol transferase MdoB-like AlkP superfamily enzyme
MLQSLRWDRMGLTQEFWGGFAALLATALALFFKFRLANWAYAATVAWGLAGVAAQQWNDRDGHGVTATAVIALICAVLIPASLFLKRKMNPIVLPRNTQGRTPETA